MINKESSAIPMWKVEEGCRYTFLLRYRLQSWTKGWRQIPKIKQTSFILWNVLQLILRNFLRKNVKIWLLGGRSATRHQIQAFQRFS